MKIIKSCLYVCFVWISVITTSDLQVAIQAQQTQKIPIGIVYVGKKNSAGKGIIERLQKDIQYSGQCQVAVRYVSSIKKTSELKKLFSDEVNLAIFISSEDSQYVWRLYDLLMIDMIQAGKVAKKNQSNQLIAHRLADQVWPALMGTQGSFCSKVAYCKQIWKRKFNHEKPYKQIWIADFDGSNPKLFIDIPTVSLAPRWGNNESCPLLFYSENTLSNVQLVMSNMFHKRQVMCCFDGLNMQPTFSADGKEVVFCLSKDGSSQLYHSYVDALSKKRKCERLTHNDGNNIAPCFIDQDHVAFVCDAQTRRPQIYIMNIATRSMKKITDGGYCACPAYCPINNKLAYSKMVDGAMQLFEYNCSTRYHRQLTQGYGSKEEPSWSACGNYIIFGMNEGLQSRIAQLNILTGKMRYITPSGDHCTYPSCSPVYQEHIGILA